MASFSRTSPAVSAQMSRLHHHHKLIGKRPTQLGANLRRASCNTVLTALELFDVLEVEAEYP
jgi:UDP-N-acetylmuramyl pentapeptide phosphotransferase/UDP-N-acetylglucosamine-1-phosphate transferase